MKEVLAHRGAKVILETLMKVKQGENVCIVTDTNKIDVAKVLMAETVSIGADVSLCVMKPQKTNGEEPPPPIAAAMKASDVTLSPTTKIISHTKARLEAQQVGCRHCLMSDFTLDMLISGGIEADFVGIKPKVEKLAALLANAKELRLTTPAGTDLKMRVEGRRGNAYHGFGDSPGMFSTCQCIEANISPIEMQSEGTLVVDAGIAGWIVIEKPIQMEVKNGRIASIEGGREAEIIRDHLMKKEDPNVYNIAELGIGLNPKCKLLGLVMEDEGVLGTAHIGIGSNITLGGKQHAKGHEDLIIWNPCLEADGKVLLKGKEHYF